MHDLVSRVCELRTSTCKHEAKNRCDYYQAHSAMRCYKHLSKREHVLSVSTLIWSPTPDVRQLRSTANVNEVSKPCFKPCFKTS